VRAGRRLKNSWKKDGMIKVWTDAAEAGHSIVTASAEAHLLTSLALRPRARSR
jgi:hypothetical protein